jgi:hypothetical protein
MTREMRRRFLLGDEEIDGREIGVCAFLVERDQNLARAAAERMTEESHRNLRA